MQVFALLPILASFLAVSQVSAHSAFIEGAVTKSCLKEKVVHEELIGENKDVKLQYSHCENGVHVAADGVEHSSLSKRQSSNVCGAPCNTFCFSPSGGGPNQGDCTVIADALLFESQNTGVFFNATASGTPTDQITLQYKSCLTFFLNQDFNNVTYCRTDWSTLVNWLASDCDATNNAHGGLCVADDQRWFIQVQNSSG